MVRLNFFRIIYLSIVLAIFTFSNSTPADESDLVRAFGYITLEGRGELGKVLKSRGIGPTVKMAAIRRLAQMARDVRPGSANKIHPSELYRPILGQLDSKINLIRKTACRALISFAAMKGSSELTAPLGKIVRSQKESYELRIEAATALGRFSRDSVAAMRILLPVLQAEMKKKAGNNIEFVTVLIHSIGRLQEKRSFVTLMRVLESPYPISVKRAAQRALENIRWK